MFRETVNFLLAYSQIKFLKIFNSNSLPQINNLQFEEYRKMFFDTGQNCYPLRKLISESDALNQQCQNILRSLNESHRNKLKIDVVQESILDIKWLVYEDTFKPLKPVSHNSFLMNLQGLGLVKFTQYAEFDFPTKKLKGYLYMELNKNTSKFM